MAYQNLSHTEVTISHKAKLSGIYETKVWDNSISHGWLLGKAFYSIERHILAETRVKRIVFSPAMGYGNLSNGYQPIRMGKFSGDRINYIYLRSDFKSITKYTLLQNKTGR